MEDKEQTLIQGYDSPEMWQDVSKPSSLPRCLDKHVPVTQL